MISNSQPMVSVSVDTLQEIRAVLIGIEDDLACKTNPCSIPECGKPHKAHGFCRKHYQRWHKHGDPLLKRVRRLNKVEEFYQNTVLTYEGEECLIWPYSTVNGYGRMARDRKIGIVSRFLCEDSYGPPPTPKHDAAHSCGKGKQGCVTKGHLSWKTRAENAADRLIHGTHNRGERCPTSKLTDAQAREIIFLRGKLRPMAIAEEYGISPVTVLDIQTGRTWAWLHEEIAQ